MKIKRLIVAALLALSLATLPRAVLADSGCNSEVCYQSGYYLEWSWFGPYACYWWYVQYFTPPYNTIYGDCHGNYTY